MRLSGSGRMGVGWRTFFFCWDGGQVMDGWSKDSD
jgi:hypothetical protein